MSLWVLHCSNFSLKTGLNCIWELNSAVELIFSPYILLIMVQDMFQYWERLQAPKDGALQESAGKTALQPIAPNFQLSRQNSEDGFTPELSQQRPHRWGDKSFLGKPLTKRTILLQSAGIQR